MSDVSSPDQKPSSNSPLATQRSRIALAGNPNTGKTTLFNRLTGLRARTANYPGITVDLRKGSMWLANGPVDVIDLPGTYSLEATSPEEKVAQVILQGNHTAEPAPDVVILVLDATNLERNLFLASEVLDLKRPTVVALNLIDAANAADINIKVEQLSKELRCPVIPVSSKHGTGIEQLKQVLDSLLGSSLPVLAADHTSCTAGCTGCTFSARYDWAADVSTATVNAPADQGRRTSAIDRLVTNPFIGTGVFLAIMLGVFYLIFSLASVPMDLIDGVFANLGGLVEQLLPETSLAFPLWFPMAATGSLLMFGASYWAAGIRWTKTSSAVAIMVSVLLACMPLDDFRSLLVDGVVAGVGGSSFFFRKSAFCSFSFRYWKTAGTWRAPPL